MAHVFYPSGSRTYIRQVSGSNLYEFFVNTQDGVVFYLTGSNYATASLTASYAISASYAPTITTGLTDTRSFTDATNSNAHVIHILQGRIITWDVIPF